MKIEIDDKDVKDTDAIYIIREKSNDEGFVVHRIPVEPKTPGRWRAKYHEVYWFISDAGIISNDIECNTSIDIARYRSSNYYKTMEEAKFALERKKVINELELYTVKEIDEDTPYWSIKCKRRNDTVDICVLWHGYAIDTDPFMFASEEDAKTTIAAIGEERLKKYFFRIKED